MEREVEGVVDNVSAWCVCAWCLKLCVQDKTKAVVVVVGGVIPYASELKYNWSDGIVCTRVMKK